MNIQDYFQEITQKVERAYTRAQEARLKNHDPEPRVDIPLAKGMAERVEGLVSAAWPAIFHSGVAQRIIALEKEFGVLDWRVALTVAHEVALGTFCSFPSRKEAMETGIRVGLAYITLGVIAAPLEGFIDLTIKKRKDGKEYLAANFAGPIRAAGGTAAAVSVIIADYVRSKMGIAPYDIDQREQKRYWCEIQDYHERCTNLQYFPSEAEIDFLVTHLPIEIDGDPTETVEVSNYKDLPRIATNRVRGGMCLVLAEGLAQKAPKVAKQLEKWGSSFGLDQWMWMKEFLDLQKKIKAKGGIKKDDTTAKLLPNYTFIKDLVAGRPVLTAPLAQGGFRLRYGRARTSGFAAQCIHPATMSVLANYIATGTQLKVERPGKATVISPCDTIQGPIVTLTTGEVMYLDSEAKAKKHKNQIQEILYLGDLLINYGDFYVNNHPLVPAGYNEDWYCAEAEAAMQTKYGRIAIEKLAQETTIDDRKLTRFFLCPNNIEWTFAEAAQLSKTLNIPLHPHYTYHWNALLPQQFTHLLQCFTQAKIYYNEIELEKIVLSKDNEAKRALELLGIPHIYPQQEHIVIEKEHAQALYTVLGCFTRQPTKENSPLEAVNTLSPFCMRDKSGTFIGARMGRPEKAKQRKLIGSPHTLFPVGEEGGKLRTFQAAMNTGGVCAQFPLFFCPACKKESIYRRCHRCAQETQQQYFCRQCGVIATQACIHGNAVSYTQRKLPLREYVESALHTMNTKILPEMVKGVRGTSNKHHVPEHIVKGILRAKYNLSVNKDGTTRYDMIEMPITHFKPKEIGVSIPKLHELGYTTDKDGNPLHAEDQILELLPQDVILPSCTETEDEPAEDVLYRLTLFLDELLVKLYHLPPFYNLQKKEDILGHLLVGLAPHTSAGILIRVIGFSKTQGMYCHPMLHAAMRRNCDGDEAGIILLLDALVNFSRSFLPDKRGSRTMDSPLVLTSTLIPGEVDDEVHGIDIAWRYPLELYQAAAQYKSPGEVKILQLKDVLHTPQQYTSFGFTHDTNDINDGVRCSAYKLLPSMEEKLKGQMILAEKIRAVDPMQVATYVIEKHFLKDTKGNLRKYFHQQFRCSKCNTIYRRPPLLGRCLKCSGPLIFTIAEGSVSKYLEPSISLARKYNVSPYLKQTLDLLQIYISEIFGKEKEKQEGLGKWFG